jgi:hypothetical protein
VIVLLVLGAAALWGSSRLTWTSQSVDRAGSGVAVVSRTGAEVVPGLVPLAVLALAAIAATVALGGWARRVLGVLVALAGVGAVWLPVSASGGAAPRALAVAGGLSVLVAGVLLVWRANRMTRLGGSYQTPGAAKRAADPDKEMWNALERGDDPTDSGAADRD